MIAAEAHLTYMYALTDIKVKNMGGD